MKVSVIIPSAGSGSRFGELKQFKLLNGEPLIIRTIKLFLDLKEVVEVIVVLPKEQNVFLNKYIKNNLYQKKIKVVAGGEKRQDSILNGLKIVCDKSQLICIHDAVRPFVSRELIINCFKKCKNFDGAILGLRSINTVKYSENGTINKTIDRRKIWLAQTPQVFHKEKLIFAIKKFKKKEMQITDESILMEEAGYSIKLVEGSVNNIKITFNSDWKLAEYLIKVL